MIMHNVNNLTQSEDIQYDELLQSLAELCSNASELVSERIAELKAISVFFDICDHRDELIGTKYESRAEDLYLEARSALVNNQMAKVSGRIDKINHFLANIENLIHEEEPEIDEFEMPDEALERLMRDLQNLEESEDECDINSEPDDSIYKEMYEEERKYSEFLQNLLDEAYDKLAEAQQKLAENREAQVKDALLEAYRKEFVASLYDPNKVQKRNKEG